MKEGSGAVEAWGAGTRRAQGGHGEVRCAYPAHGGADKLAADADGIEQHGQAATGAHRLVLLGEDPGAERQGVGLQQAAGASGRVSEWRGSAAAAAAAPLARGFTLPASGRAAI